MEVILKENFPALGYIGDKVNVKPGYARNFLIPRGMAVEVTSANANVLKHKIAAINAKKIKLKAEAEAYASQLEKIELEFTLKAGSQGKSFGSITARDIDQALQAKSVTLDRRQIRLVEPIKGGGEYTVEIKLHPEVIAPIKVKVTTERQEKKEAKEAQEGEAKSKRSKKAKEGEGEEAGEAASQEQAE